MNEHSDAAPTAALEALRLLANRLAGGPAPSPVEIEGALESGFGVLIALEARLQRARVRASGAESEGRQPSASIHEIERDIASLRAVIEEVRKASRAELPAGLVLPGTRR